MRNSRVTGQTAVGIGIAVVVAALCFVALAFGNSLIEKPQAVDAEQYAEFMANEAYDLGDLAAGAEIQRMMFNRMTPPGFSWIQPMFPSVAPFAAEDFDVTFLAGLLGEDVNSVVVYPLTLVLDPKTRETLVYNAEEILIAAMSAEDIPHVWPEDVDPTRVVLQLDLLPAEDVEPYLYTESRIADSLTLAKAPSPKGGGMQKSLGSTNFGFCNIQKLTFTNTLVTVTNGTDVAEVYAYTVMHTTTVVVVTNEGVVETNILWTPVSPAFNGLDGTWECQTTNHVLTNGVGAWQDAAIPTNISARFYATAKRVDSDADGLTDGSEFFLYGTSPEIADTDGDGLTDGEEVLEFSSDPEEVCTAGDGLSDGWKVQYGFDPAVAVPSGCKPTFW